MQQLLKKINFYIESLKTYKDRFLKNFNFDIKVHLKQHNFNKQNKDIYNKFIFNEMIAIIIFFDNISSDRVIEQNILIQSIYNDLISIFF